MYRSLKLTFYTFNSHCLNGVIRTFQLSFTNYAKSSCTYIIIMYALIHL